MKMKMLMDSLEYGCSVITPFMSKQHLPMIVTMITVLVQAATAVNSFIMVTIHHNDHVFAFKRREQKQPEHIMSFNNQSNDDNVYNNEGVIKLSSRS
jgi:hypothetical protein